MKTIHVQVGPGLERHWSVLQCLFFDKKALKILSVSQCLSAEHKFWIALKISTSTDRNSVTFPTLPGTTWSMDRGLTFFIFIQARIFSFLSRRTKSTSSLCIDLRFRIFVGEPEDERGPVLVTDRKSSPQRSNHHMHQPIMESLDREVPCCLWRESLNQVKVTSRPRPYSELLMKIPNQKGAFFVHCERNRRK